MEHKKFEASPPKAAVAVLIADLVGSRAARERGRVHDRVSKVLDDDTAGLAPLRPLRVTVGDEYQGVFADVGAALRAALWLRVTLSIGDPVVDVRHGIGWGTTHPLQEDPPVEDGPAWWAARDALDAVEAASRRPGRGSRRTGYGCADGVAGPNPAVVEAMLVCQDLLVGSLSERSTRLLHGLLVGRSQAELAEAEGISASAVSQRVRHDGLVALLDVDELLRRVT